jgi:hypothetical protein
MSVIGDRSAGFCVTLSGVGEKYPAGRGAAPITISRKMTVESPAKARRSNVDCSRQSGLNPREVHDK